LRGETTKSRRTRFVPIATARLRAVLEWLQLDADGKKKPNDALVFSDETGEPVGSFRTAWVTAVLKAARREAGVGSRTTPAAAARLERGETFDPTPRIGLTVSLSGFCQEFARAPADDTNRVSEH